MATLQASSSQFDFVEAPLKELFSPVTSDLLKEPHQTLCCGNHLSQNTVTKLQQDGEPCPLCKKTLKTVPDKFFQRKLNQLQVYCPNKSQGCEWVGELGSLEKHLSQESVEGECQFVTVACSYLCSGNFQRCQLENHMTTACPNRPIACQYCQEIICNKQSGEHQLVCKKVPIECTAKSLGCEWAGPRGDLGTHLNEESAEGECQFVTVACPYSCGSLIQRCKIGEHTTNDCPNRAFTCEHCGEDFPYNKITSEHLPVCQKYPVDCPSKSTGCEWAGIRGHLDAHLNENSAEGECQFVVAACPYSCGVHLHRYQLKNHTMNDCSNRPFTCEHCGKDFPYEKITSEHLPACKKYPIECPNKSLGCEWTGIRGDIDTHLKEDSVAGECQHATVACPHLCDGGKFQRCELEKHTTNDCSNRPFACQYCGQEFPYDKITSEHQPICKKYRIDCPNKSLGCEWAGVRGNLDAHLKENSMEGECAFVTVACPHFCGSNFERRRLEEHKANACPNHRVTFQISARDHKATYNKVTSENQTDHKRYPIDCPNKGLGCEWAGVQDDLNSHLNADSVEGKCQFVTVACPYSCGKYFQRSQFEEHRVKDCPNRSPICQYCNCKTSHNKPTNEHLSVCKRYPLECPNQCGENAIERQDLLKHLSETCPLQVVKCDYSHAGCEVECQRQHMQTHLDEYVKSHLAKVSCKTVQQQQVIQQYKRQIDAMVAELNRVVGPTFGPPFDTVMTDFEKHKKAGDEWFSPPFYSHIGGYKMCLEVDANGLNNGKGTHISVYLYLMSGEHDDQLKWPFRGDVTIQLLNQRKDEGHWEMTLSIDDEVDDAYTSRVVGQDRANCAQGYNQFISHTELRTKDKEYLKNDSLKFRISKVVVKSV